MSPFFSQIGLLEALITLPEQYGDMLCFFSVVVFFDTEVHGHWVECFLSPEPTSTKWGLING